MQEWQKDRNYRQIKDENDNIIESIITIDGTEVSVSKEVFEAYSTGDRSERYQDERDHGKPRDRRNAKSEEKAKEKKPKVVSLDFLCECGVPVDSLFGHEPSAEQVIVQREAETERLEQEKQRKILKKLLPDALKSLDEDEASLIQALFFDGMSMRQYAQVSGMSDKTVARHKKKILEKIKKFLLK